MRRRRRGRKRGGRGGGEGEEGEPGGIPEQLVHDDLALGVHAPHDRVEGHRVLHRPDDHLELRIAHLVEEVEEVVEVVEGVKPTCWRNMSSPGRFWNLQPCLWVQSELTRRPVI